MRTNERAGDAFCLDLGHVTGYALTAWAASLVVSMFFEACGMRSVGRTRTVTVKAELICRFAELSIIAGAVDIVTAGAGHSVSIHHALDEIIPLHPILVCRAICKVQKVGLSKGDVFELPIIGQMQTDVIADRPVIGFAVDETGTRASLGMALDAGIVRSHIIHL